MKPPHPISPSTTLPTKILSSDSTGPAHPSTPASGGPEAIPPPWAWHFRTLLHLRHRLQRAHAEHMGAAGTPPEAGGIDLADSVQDRIDRDLLWAELGAESDKLFEVDCALQRIRDGTYGFCEETGHPIPPERLRAIPWTRYCHRVAATHETRRPRAE